MKETVYELRNHSVIGIRHLGNFKSLDDALSESEYKNCVDQGNLLSDYNEITVIRNGKIESSQNYI